MSNRGQTDKSSRQSKDSDKSRSSTPTITRDHENGDSCSEKAGSPSRDHSPRRSPSPRRNHSPRRSHSPRRDRSPRESFSREQYNEILRELRSLQDTWTREISSVGRQLGDIRIRQQEHSRVLREQLVAVRAERNELRRLVQRLSERDAAMSAPASSEPRFQEEPRVNEQPSRPNWNDFSQQDNQMAMRETWEREENNRQSAAPARIPSLFDEFINFYQPQGFCEQEPVPLLSQGMPSISGSNRSNNPPPLMDFDSLPNVKGPKRSLDQAAARLLKKVTEALQRDYCPPMLDGGNRGDDRDRFAGSSRSSQGNSGRKGSFKRPNPPSLLEGMSLQPKRSKASNAGRASSSRQSGSKFDMDSDDDNRFLDYDPGTFRWNKKN